MTVTQELCEVCNIHRNALQCASLECFRGHGWIVRHHLHPSPLVGWFFLCSERHVQGVADLNDTEAKQFGPALRAVSQAVRAVTGCDRVYQIAFGQGAPHLHVHLIPRFDHDPATRAWSVADWYRAVEGGQKPGASEAAVQACVEQMRAAFIEMNFARNLSETADA